MKNWRVINNRKIQTWAKEVFLWDNEEGVAVRAPVPGRPWNKLSEAFVAWMPAEGWAEGDYPQPPVGILERTKVTMETGDTITYDNPGVDGIIFADIGS